eukprot:Awhi_evm1s2035
MTIVGDNVNGDTVAYAPLMLEKTSLQFKNKTDDLDDLQSFRILPSPFKIMSLGGCIKWHDDIVIKLNNDEVYSDNQTR